jgi:hypothetical protein
MIIHADIMRDFGRALADLNKVLMIKKNTEEVQDAQIFSFMRANAVFRALIFNIYAENSDDEVMDLEQMIIAFYALDIISEEQANRLIEQSNTAHLLSLDKGWLDGDDVCFFDEEVASLSTYYEDMRTLLDNLRKVGTLVTYEEDHDGH